MLGAEAHADQPRRKPPQIGEAVEQPGHQHHGGLGADARALGLAFFQGQYTQGFTLLAAGACIVATPVVLLYVFLQRHFIAGMLEGAVRE